jgi:hypothetical protein
MPLRCSWLRISHPAEPCPKDFVQQSWALNPRLRCFQRLLAQCPQRCLARAAGLRSFVFFVSHLSCSVGARLVDAWVSVGTRKILLWKHSHRRMVVQDFQQVSLASWVSFCALVAHTPSLQQQPQLAVGQSLPYSADLAFLLVCLKRPMVRVEAQ